MAILVKLKRRPENLLIIQRLVGIWICLRETIRHIIDHHSHKYVTSLAIGSGIYQAVDNVSTQSWFDGIPLWGIVLLVVVIGVVAGLAGLTITSALFGLGGHLLGGQGTL